MRSRLTTFVAIIATSALLVACTKDEPTSQSDSQRPHDPGTITATTQSLSPTKDATVRVTATIAHGLEVPWGLAFLPDGSALVSQRNQGTISSIDHGVVTEVGQIPETAPTSEGGLLGLAVSPEFATDQKVFAYVTTNEDNRVLSMAYDGHTISKVTPILTGIPFGSIHDGGRLAFGPDGYLYVSTGETGNGDLAADRGSLGGKILRITAEGKPAPGNPDSRSPVWTFGHRNIQGLAFDDHDRLWASEFGSDVWDEVNRVERGNNYGWPAAEGDANLKGLTDPLVQWRPEDASPSGLAFANGALWTAGLRGERLWEIPVESNGTLGQPLAHFVGKYGRLRTVVAAPDGSLWLTTSNRDGRGFPAAGDDRIFRVSID
ncbi:MAG: PQQ-dependent sugar dehydrogenase [Nocardioidaceae bacterium]